MLTAEEQLDEARRLLTKAQEIYEDPESTAEDKKKADKLTREGKAHGKQAEAKIGLMRVAVLEDPVMHGGGFQTKGLTSTVPYRSPAQFASKGAVGSEFKSMQHFWEAAWLAGNPKAPVADKRLKVLVEDKSGDNFEIKQMVESTGAEGGFLVPVQFYNKLQAIAAEQSIVRPLATIVPMNRRQVDIPVVDQSGTASGRSNLFGGAIFYYSEEASEKTFTDIDWRKVSLVAHKLIGYTRASDELVSDAAISLGDFITGPLGFAGGIAWEEDYAFLRGNGVGRPLGILNAGATIVVARAAGGTISYVDLAQMYEHLHPAAHNGAIWVCTQSAVSELLQIVDPNGNYIWQPNAREGVPQTIFGMPIRFTEKLPLIGSQGDILLCNFRYYLVGDRANTTIESTQYDYWRYDQTSWRVVHRYDGQPYLNTWITGADGTTTMSPFVMLGAKST